MKKILFILALALFGGGAFAQKSRVYFSDKGASTALLGKPKKVLSERALARRARQGIALAEDDLPVDPAYLAALRQRGFRVLLHSRWFNYALVEGLGAAALSNLPFVRKVESPRRYCSHFAATATNFNYGSGRNQIEILNGQELHRRGFTGRGMTIAVLDGGFTGATTPAFDSLWLGGQILATYSFVTRDTNVIQRGSHGASVLSVMGANVPGSLVGTAPHANYLLLTSEDELSETPVELDYWAMAAEYADSAGADVINSSLGYTTFDDPADDFTYEDMDGRSTVASLAAVRAARKGIVVVVAAGNAGATPWRYIGAPADADSIIAVGGIDGQGRYVSFSSVGPSYDRRIKPEVAAVAAGTAVVSSQGNVRGSFGTSFASPAIAGLAACLRQAHPSLSVQQLREQILRSAHQYNFPDSLLGYGIPNFELAFYLNAKEAPLQALEMSVYPLPFRERLHLQPLGHSHSKSFEARITDLQGRELLRETRILQPGEVWSLHLPYTEGVYILKINSGSQQWSQKIVKQP